MRLVTLFQQLSAVVVWEVVDTHRTMALVYHVHKVSSTIQQRESYYACFNLIAGTQ